LSSEILNSLKTLSRTVSSAFLPTPVMGDEVAVKNNDRKSITAGILEISGMRDKFRFLGTTNPQILVS
jgi:hypothetical protein